MISVCNTDDFDLAEYFVIPSSFCFSSAADEVITSHGAIEPDKDNIRQEPYSLPQGFMWDTLDLNNADVVSKMLSLILTLAAQKVLLSWV